MLASLPLDFLPEAYRAWFVLAIAMVVAVIIALIVHRIGFLVLRRITAPRPYLHAVVVGGCTASQFVMALLAIRVVLSGAPADMPYTRGLAYVVTVALILCLTWWANSCIKSLSDTAIRLNPYDVADNLRARRMLTQTRVLARSAHAVILLLGLSFVLLTLPGVRQIGASLLASAGVAGLIAGIAARPVLGNFIAGLQIAFSQPIRIDDVLIVNGEWGRVEEITGTFVVVRIWDERRMIVPLQWFIENPFENWTHRTASLLGTVFLWLDFSVPLEPVRKEFERLCKESPLWDTRVAVVQVTDTTDRAMQVRFLVSAANSGQAFDLRCYLRERLIAFISERYPGGLPRVRAQLGRERDDATPEGRVIPV
ncbi:mechanosensitive ion channel protein MscS [Pigmentiphaga sp. NML080357]|uniref:mechanosensitive ion channel family protein n=1 Tax=Pigmentiphaga sp. NML080357 TaxID=2008675 RepID=UPI000B41CE16|nr:mechanosensitive ion channel domain-containing protein [Pigmentiphaga sp. NML080357]OVZ55159.1 mechanosensitive ion channel protein MscS [Pigmentiphaga sp. NML080357]